jgi:hypothetical protein
LREGKAIAIENLKKLKKGKRGDGKADTKKKTSQLECQKVPAKAKKGSNVKGSGSNRGSIPPIPQL